MIVQSRIQEQTQEDDGDDVEPAIRLTDVNLYYGPSRAVKDVTLTIQPRQVTAIIGPSGCGKSTLLRTLNRINERIPGFRVEGTVMVGDVDVYDAMTDVVDVRQRVGMVFQRPNPFPQSIFDNVAFGPRLYGGMGRNELAEIVEQALRSAALWDDVKDSLRRSAMQLSGGQQQRLCIARALATQPEVLLMDEPASALDPIATGRIEELIDTLKERYTVVVVTHNMQQAARASDSTIMMNLDPEDKAGFIVEVGSTTQMFTRPQHPQTEAYISGRFG
ncbi:MAG: phosphate ABC transporter ATP-binding protein PstB [Herpetosiphon sp.]